MVSPDLAMCNLNRFPLSGIFDTALVGYLPDDVKTFLAEQTLSPPRLGRPPEFGHLVQYILENPYLNGEVIRLDGGARIRS